MATNKNAQLRYNIIDRCLSNFQRKHTLYSILEEVNQALVENGFDGIQKRQLQEDIKFMQSDAGFSIQLQEGLKDGKKKVLRYTDTAFSIAQHPLNQLDKEQLKATLTVLSRYKNRADFAWLEEFIPRMQQSFDLLSKAETGIISYQKNPDLVGANWIDVLFNLIAKKKTIKLEYQPFDKEINTVLVHPYHLKQFNNRWFLMGKTQGFDQISTYPLDRISHIEESGIPYESCTINWVDYFDDMIGVSKPEHLEIETVLLKFSPNRINYVKTKPLHGTQKILKNDASGLSIQIEVIPNFELHQSILAFGADVQVIQPQSLRESILEIIEKMQHNYTYADSAHT